MFLPAHLRRSRHRVYYFRIVLPDGLKEVFGKREFIRSLGTKCPRQARLAAGLLSSTLAVKRSEGAAAFERAIRNMRPKNAMDLKFGEILMRDGTQLRNVEVEVLRVPLLGRT
jgi:hypothetical protein